MDSLAATFRSLYSREADAASKLAAAERLVGSLLEAARPGPGSEAGAGLPPLVRAHHLRSLLEWAIGAVAKRGSATAAAGGADGKKGKKRKQQEAKDEAGCAAAGLEPRHWAVLTAVLRSSGVPASQPLPAALLPAATVMLRALRDEGQQRPAEQRRQLLSQAASLLQLLHGKFGASFRPGIEHAAAAAEAALAGHATAGGQVDQQPWAAVAVAASHLLLAAAAGHPNPRKVWDATVPRLLPLLAQAAFPPGSGSDPDLAACCLQLLTALLFNQQHVPALAATAAAEMAAATAAAGNALPPAAEEAAGEGAAEGGQQPQPQRGSGYGAQLLGALAQHVAAGQLPYALLPWMAGQFCAALHQHRRAAETEAAITTQAGQRGQRWGQEAGEGGGEGGPAGPGPAASQGAHSPSGGISVSADFHFWVALMRTLLPHVEQLAAGAGGDELAAAVGGVALLAAALHAHQLYRPTQDRGGQQRALLQRLADAALLLAQREQQGGAPAAGVAPAALGVLRGILAVEHRGIQQQLPLLWPLLLWSPPSNAASTSNGVAVDVACSLVAAFADLRQLEVLLRSLTAALRAQPDGAPGEAAAAVLSSGQFGAALAAAVRQLPSGQVAMVTRLAAEAVPAASSGGQLGQLVTADVFCCCLSSLRVDLTTAQPAASAAQALVAALGPALLPLLADADGGADGKASRRQKAAGADQQLLPCLLRLYRHALALHARCAGLHPEVVELPGQQVRQATGTALGASNAGYFAPLESEAGRTQAPPVAALLKAADRGSALHTAVLEAAEQRLGVLHQRHQFLTHSCPVTLLPAEGAEDAEQQQQPVQVQQQQQQAAEAELRQLATLVAAAAADQAASSGSSDCAALRVAVSVLPVLSAWADTAQLRALLQACLRQSAGVGPSTDAAAQHLCRQLLCSDDLQEQGRLVAVLPAAVAAELAAMLSGAFGGGAAAAGGPQPKKRKHKEAPVAGSGSGSAHLAPLLEQLQRVAQGKAAKVEGWAAALEGACAEMTALAAGAAGAGQGGDSSKRRKGGSGAGATPVGDGLANTVAVAGALRMAQQVAQQLAQLPLGHLPAEAAAGMAAAATASLLCCWQGSLALLAAGHDSAGQDRLAGTALAATNACLSLLAALACGGGLASQEQLLPQVLQAGLVAAGNATGGANQERNLCVAAQHSSSVMAAVCAAHLAAGDGGNLQRTAAELSRQLSGEGAPRQWAAAVLAHSCLTACQAAVAEASGSRAATDVLCAAGGAERQPDDIAAALVASTAGPLDGAIAAALLPAAKAAAAPRAGWQPRLTAASLYRGAAALLRLRCCDHPAADALEQRLPGGGASCVSAMAAGLQAAASQLAQQTGGALLQSALLDFVDAACRLTGRMRPAASPAHYASLLALLLHLLAARQPEGAAEVAGLSPARHTIPFAAAFPAGGGSRAPLLEALRELLAGSSSQQLLLPLRFVEASLPAAPSGSAAALPLCELLLALLEAAGGGQQQRLLGQHSERLAGLLTAFLEGAAYGGQSQRRPAEAPAPRQLAAAILAAGQGSGDAAAALAAPPASQEDEASEPAAAEVAALCTALRALESLAARPKLFPLTPAAACGMLASVVALWTGYSEQRASGAAAPVPGFRLGTGGGAAPFSASCRLLLALLRHRQPALRRCLPLLLQAVRLLLRFLAAAELSARLRRQAGGQPHRGWRVACAELLAAVMAELAGLKDAGVGRYCPHLLADYVLLAAAPPSARSRALLRFPAPDAATAAAADEEAALAGEPLSAEAAAALRQGAFALYGACSAAEIQFLYASLGAAAPPSGGPRGAAAAASWRGALAGLKAEYEKGGKYSGKV